MAQVIFNSGDGTTRNLPVMGFEQLAVSNSVVTLTASKYQATITVGGQDNISGKVVIKAKRAVITVGGNSVRVTLDGTAPVGTTTGHLFVAGDTIELTTQEQIEGFKVIRDSADASLAVTYFGA